MRTLKVRGLCVCVCVCVCVVESVALGGRRIGAYAWGREERGQEGGVEFVAEEVRMLREDGGGGGSGSVHGDRIGAFAEGEGVCVRVCARVCACVHVCVCVWSNLSHTTKEVRMLKEGWWWWCGGGGVRLCVRR